MNKNEFLKNIQEEKKYTVKSFKFPAQNECIMLSGKGLKTKNDYIIDINRKQATLERITFQDRFQTTIVLLRLDIGTKIHTNPDNKKVSGNHIHIYCDDYKDTFAYELDDLILSEINPNFDLSRFKTNNHYDLFYNFSKFCNFIDKPLMETTFY